MQAALKSPHLYLRTGHVWLDTAGLVHAVVDPDAELDLEDAREWIRLIRVATEGRSRPLMVDFGRMKAMSHEARAYFAGPECASVRSAAALVMGSPVERALGNLHAALNKPLLPTKRFSDQATALAWLRRFQ